MGICDLIQKWSGIDQSDQLVILVDDKQKNIADSMMEEGMLDIQMKHFAEDGELFSLLKSLKSHDLVMVLL